LLTIYNSKLIIALMDNMPVVNIFFHFGWKYLPQNISLMVSLVERSLKVCGFKAFIGMKK